MSNVSFILLYAENVARSVEFYSALLDKPLPEASETFALLPVAPGLILGLWRQGDVAPAPQGRPGASEMQSPSATTRLWTPPSRDGRRGARPSR